MNDNAVSLGLDFGTESVRALFVRMNGQQVGEAVVPFAHGQIVESLPTTGETLPPDYALQHPTDWLDASAQAVQQALHEGKVQPQDIIGIGVDFTSCTMLPTRIDGTPLCLSDEFGKCPLAWPKLWKHHGAKSQTDRMNQLARERREPWLSRYGGGIGLEWFFPKILETLEVEEAVYDAADVWLEGGDWFVWQLIGGPASELPRSTCQAGYKGMWDAKDGFPSTEYFAALHPKLTDVVTAKMPGKFAAPGTRVGGLCAESARRMGLPEGIPVSAAIIDAHAGAVGVGAEPGTLVMVMGTSSCHMLNSEAFQEVPGVAGIVKDGILPGYYGHETGQAAVGDAFDWTRKFLGAEDFRTLTQAAASIPPGAEGVLCVDWFNGCRTPLMDGSLRGAFLGLTLHHTSAHAYRAALEASAFGVRWIVDLLREHKVPVSRFVATGGLPHHNPLLMQIYADVLDEPVHVPETKQGPALGAAILGALAAGVDTKAAMALAHNQKGIVFEPNASVRAVYEECYRRYRECCDLLRKAK